MSFSQEWSANHFLRFSERGKKKKSRRGGEETIEEEKKKKEGKRKEESLPVESLNRPSVIR